jgi:hypothetical protein
MKKIASSDVNNASGSLHGKQLQKHCGVVEMANPLAKITPHSVSRSTTKTQHEAFKSINEGQHFSKFFRNV